MTVTSDLYIVKFIKSGNIYTVDGNGNVHYQEEQSAISTEDRDGVRISPAEISINNGTTQELSIITNAQIANVKISSSDENIIELVRENNNVKVENGKFYVIAKKLGKAKVTVELTNGKKAVTYIYVHQEPTAVKLQTEQEIIDIAKVSNYPNTFLNLSSTIKNRLEKNVYIKSAKVYKKSFTILYIEVEENRPLFYNSSSNETVLLDGKTVQEKLEAPVLINMIPDTLYEKFIKKISEIDYDVLKRVSEIKYDKNEVDETRFLFTMNDGNYVYLTLNTFEKINNYINIVKTFNNSKGVLYLDSGEYFEIFKN